MADRVNVQRRVSSLDISPEFENYSKVIINIDDDTQVSAGDDTGRTLEVTNPFGTEAMARAMLAKLNGVQYQPYTASDAMLDPAAEIGDGVNIRDVYSGIYARSRTFDRQMKADISAPSDEEIDHEYEWVSPSERKFKREVGNVRASLLIQTGLIEAEVTRATAAEGTLRSRLAVQENEISAKVSQTGGNRSTFGWSLLSNEFGLYSGSTKVFSVNSSGANVKGQITATSGYIGNGSNGFTISATAIYNNISKFGGTQTKGIYLGTDGIQLGQGFKVNSSGQVTATSGKIGGFTITSDTIHNYSNNKGVWMKAVSSGTAFRIGSRFSVDADGNLTANSGTFAGSVRAGGIKYGGSYGTFSGGGITGGSIGTSALSSYVSGGVGGGVSFNNATTKNTKTMPSYFYAKTISATTLATQSCTISGTFKLGNFTVSRQYLGYKDASGNTQYAGFLVAS